MGFEGSICCLRVPEGLSFWKAFFFGRRAPCCLSTFLQTDMEHETDRALQRLIFPKNVDLKRFHVTLEESRCVKRSLKDVFGHSLAKVSSEVDCFFLFIFP